MKKIYNTLVIILFSTTSINFINAKVRSQQTQQAQQQQKTMVKDTKKLEADLKKAKTAKTPAQKKQAEQKIYNTAQQLLLDLKDERSYIGDIYSGYTPTQVAKARATIEKLVPIKQKLEKTIENQLDELDAMTDKGRIYNSIKSEKKGEYEKLSLLLTKNKNALKRIDGAIRGQKIIAGEAWSNAFLTLSTAIAATTLLTGAVIYTYGGTAALTTATTVGTTVLNKLKNAKKWVGDTVASNWERAKLVAEYGSAAAATLGLLTEGYLKAKEYHRIAQMAADDAEAIYNHLSDDASPEDREIATADLNNTKIALQAAKKQEELALVKKQRYERDLQAKSKK